MPSDCLPQAQHRRSRVAEFPPQHSIGMRSRGILTKSKSWTCRILVRKSGRTPPPGCQRGAPRAGGGRSQDRGAGRTEASRLVLANLRCICDEQRQRQFLLYQDRRSHQSRLTIKHVFSPRKSQTQHAQPSAHLHYAARARGSKSEPSHMPTANLRILRVPTPQLARIPTESTSQVSRSQTFALWICFPGAGLGLLSGLLRDDIKIQE